tara:strand:- start:19 stop:285 length:267 start_codon:yes stop_codon:yes gene_type:complete
MPLKTETTVEYYFNNPYIYYCKEHDCLRVSEHHEDSILCNGISRKTMDFFIADYIEYVLEDTELQKAFETACKVKLLKEATDSEGRPL